MMKVSLTPQSGHQFSIMQRIIDGVLHVNSIEEFEEILDFYPDNPILFRKYADLLIEKGHREKGRRAYDRAAELFIEQGMNLQAIVAKILDWSLSSPSHDQGRRFQALLHEKGSRYTPLQRFWARMRYPELVAVMLRLVRLRVPGGEKIVAVGDPAQDVYFVVSGALSETPSQDCESQAAAMGFETEPVLLGTNDIFGDVFPLEKLTMAKTEIRSLTEVELVKISKKVLRDICKKHPNIKDLLEELCRSGSRDNCDRTWQTVRRAHRYGLPTKAEITCTAQSGANAKFFSGIAVDISLGGMCVDIGHIPSPSKKALPLKGQSVRLRLDLLNDVADLNAAGKIVWTRAQDAPKGRTMLVGIRFDSLSAEDRELLTEYCSGSIGEQNLLWSLWDTMVKTDLGLNRKGK